MSNDIIDFEKAKKRFKNATIEKDDPEVDSIEAATIVEGEEVEKARVNVLEKAAKSTINEIKNELSRQKRSGGQYVIAVIWMAD